MGVLTTLLVPCPLHTSQSSQHLKVRAGPESRVMSLTPVSPDVSPPHPMYPHCPVFDVSGIMMSSVYCNELLNAGSEARNLDDGSGGSIA